MAIMQHSTPSSVCTAHPDQRRPRIPNFLFDQSESMPPSERAKRFMRPYREASRPAICGVSPWYLGGGRRNGASARKGTEARGRIKAAPDGPEAIEAHMMSNAMGQRGVWVLPSLCGPALLDTALHSWK